MSAKNRSVLLKYTRPMKKISIDITNEIIKRLYPTSDDPDNTDRTAPITPVIGFRAISIRFDGLIIDTG